jgi:phosphatidylglycerophosphate synthase
MLDRYITPIIQSAIRSTAQAVVRRGIHADHVTLLAFCLGVFAMIGIAFHAYLTASVLILASRLCDALDGAVARLTQPTDAGGFLDITLDFLFYAGIVLAFAMADPPNHGLPAAVLLAAFIGTGASFLAFAILAAKRGITSMQRHDKSFYFLGGLTEATETLIVFVAMCVWPGWFAQIAYGFAALCAMTILTRIVGGYFTLKNS